MSARSELRPKTELARRFLQDFPTQRDGYAERKQEVYMRAVRQLDYQQRLIPPRWGSGIFA